MPVNVFPNCKESLYVTAEFPPYTNSNSTKEAINQVASKPLLPHQLIPSTLKPSKPLNHKLTLSSSGQCTPVTNVASKPIVPSAEIKTVSSSKKQRRIYSNISDLKLSPSTASSSSPIFEFRNGIQYELAPVEYFDKTVSVPPCASPSPTTSGPTLSGPKKSFVTQVASKPIHPAQLGSRALSTPPIVPGNHLIAPVTVPVIASGFTASGQIGSDSLGCSGRALSTPPPFLPTSRIPYGVSGLPLRPAVGISPFISRDYNCGTPIINTSLGFPLNANLRGHLNSQINTAVVPNINLLSSALGAACSPTTSASFVRPIQVTARTPLPILPITQNRCIVGAVSALPPCPTSCPPSCPLPCQLPIPAPYPKPCASQPCRPTELPRLSNNNLVFSGFGQIETVGSDYNNLESECRTTFKLGKLSRCGQRAKVYLGPPVHSLLSGRPFC